MLDPRTVMVAVPCYSGRVVAELAGSLIHSARLFGGVSFVPGVSHVSMARNLIAESFKRSHFEWLVSIDDDMGFHPSDFQILMTPTDSFYETKAAENQQPSPTKAAARQLPENGNPEHAFLAGADALVCAEYAYKQDEFAPCRLGLGFTRIHRSVFEKIDTLRHDDGSPRTWQFTAHGKLLTDYYPCGPIVSMHIPNAPWTGEDHGFFMLAKLAGFVPRIETRTQLFHIGTKAYPYFSPEMSGAQ